LPTSEKAPAHKTVRQLVDPLDVRNGGLRAVGLCQQVERLFVIVANWS
jgi:hypothetical protein